jgi:N-acetylmuramoyl-L-alanine amidase
VKRRGWLLVLALLFLGGVAGGWTLSDSKSPDAASTTGPRTIHEGRLAARIRQVENEVASARAPAGEETRPGAASAGGQIPRAASLAGAVIAVDPGHNGGNATHPEQIERIVPAGADGFTKPCNTTGTETNDGTLTEAEFNLEVADDLKARLEAAGAKVVMTRTNNDGVGPCVNERAEIANKADADAAISIHADGNLTAGAHGFDVIHPSPRRMVDPTEARRSLQLATQVRDALVGGGVPPANYVGENGLDERDDLGGLNLATVPAVLVELGNMRSAEEAAKLESPTYRAQLADDLASGLRRFLEAR